MINLAGKDSNVATVISKEELTDKIDIKKLPVFLQEEIELNEYNWRFYRWPKDDENLIVAQNGYDLAEANVTIETINLEIAKTISFMGGNFFIKYKRDDESHPGYLLMTNYEEGAIIIEY